PDTTLFRSGSGPSPVRVRPLPPILDSSSISPADELHSRNGRQVQSEGTAFTLSARYGNRPAVSLDDVLHQAQPESAAVNLSGDDFAAAIEGFEYVRNF